MPGLGVETDVDMRLVIGCRVPHETKQTMRTTEEHVRGGQRDNGKKKKSRHQRKKEREA